MTFLKKFFFIGFFLSFSVLADEKNGSLLAQTAAAARDNVATNLNEVVIDILRGVKDAGHEVYGASKTAIAKSVDFASEQAPLVVREFIHWKIAEAVIYLLFGVTVLCLGWFLIGRKLIECGKETRDDECQFIGWLVRIITLFIGIWIIIAHVLTVAKVSIAPRVFLIEYVANAVKK